jgi:hypothetical protein
VNTSKLPPQQLDVMKTVLSLRAQRHGMIQSKEQYKFVYATVPGTSPQVRDVMAQRVGIADAPIRRANSLAADSSQRRGGTVKEAANALLQRHLDHRIGLAQSMSGRIGHSAGPPPAEAEAGFSDSGPGTDDEQPLVIDVDDDTDPVTPWTQK